MKPVFTGRYNLLDVADKRRRSTRRHFVSERLGGVGKYGIGIWAANGASNEELELKLDDHGQLQQSYEVRRNGKTLVKTVDGKLIFRRRQPQ